MSFPTKKKLRQSGFLFSFMLIVFFTLLPLFFHDSIKLLPIAMAAFISFLSIFAPYSLRTPYEMWLKLGSLLGRLNSKIVLGLMFYVLITPTAFFRRLFSVLFTVKSAKNIKSYYNTNDLEGKSTLKDQY